MRGAERSTTFLLPLRERLSTPHPTCFAGHLLPQGEKDSAAYSSEQSVQPPFRRRGGVAVEAGAEQPEARALGVLHAVVVAQMADIDVLDLALPPFRADPLRALGAAHPVQTPAPAEGGRGVVGDQGDHRLQGL